MHSCRGQLLNGSQWQLLVHTPGSNPPCGEPQGALLQHRQQRGCLQCSVPSAGCPDTCSDWTPDPYRKPCIPVPVCMRASLASSPAVASMPIVRVEMPGQVTVSESFRLFVLLQDGGLTLSFQASHPVDIRYCTCFRSLSNAFGAFRCSCRCCCVAPALILADV